MRSHLIQRRIILNSLALDDSFLYHFVLFENHGSSNDGKIGLNECKTAGKADHLQEIVLIDETVPVFIVNRECYFESGPCAHVDELIYAALSLTVRYELTVRKRKVNFQLLHSFFFQVYLFLFLVRKLSLHKMQNTVFCERIQQRILLSFG